MGAYEARGEMILQHHKDMLEGLRQGHLDEVAKDCVSRWRIQGECDSFFNLAEAVRTLRMGNINLKGGAVGQLLRYGQNKRVEPSEGSKDGDDN